MTITEFVMYSGFLLAAYSVIGNDVIQTLGTFLSSNEKKPWYTLAFYASTILTFVLVYGWIINNGDVSYGRLIGDGHTFDNPTYQDPRDIPGFGLIYLLPPVVLLAITRLGIPVSTSFLILTFFNQKAMIDMVFKSMSGYLVAFCTAILLYLIIAKRLEKKFIENEMTRSQVQYWTVAQWVSTGLLWSQWLIQDFANIYVFLPRQVPAETLVATLVVFWVFIGFIFYSKGGAIQTIVKSKTNTSDIRSATIIDLTFAAVLFFFKELNSVPMSTTWVFIGLLAGREIGIKYFCYRNVPGETLANIGLDLAKVFLGLFVSIGLVFLIRFLGA